MEKPQKQIHGLKGQVHPVEILPGEARGNRVAVRGTEFHGEAAPFGQYQLIFMIAWIGPFGNG